MRALRRTTGRRRRTTTRTSPEELADIERREKIEKMPKHTRPRYGTVNRLRIAAQLMFSAMEIYNDELNDEYASLGKKDIKTRMAEALSFYAGNDKLKELSTLVAAAKKEAEEAEK